jgi:predicted TIM-barrel fold metal-dependent hydrolase
MVELCGSDRFFWATDFPHPDLSLLKIRSERKP